MLFSQWELLQSMMARIMCLWKCWGRENERDSRGLLGLLSGSLHISPTGYLHCAGRVVSGLLEGRKREEGGTYAILRHIVCECGDRTRLQEVGMGGRVLGEGRAAGRDYIPMLRNYRPNL